MKHCRRIDPIGFCLLLAVLSALDGRPASQLAAQEPLDADHAQKMAAGLKLFKTEIKPVLVGRCLKCHGGESIEGELDLSSRESLLAGGQSGPAIVIGKSEASLLYRTVAHLAEPNMPEDGAKLDPRNIDAIGRWIDLGAPYDQPFRKADADPLAWTRKQVDPAARQFWSFQQLSAAKAPDVGRDPWCRTEIDQFVLQKLRENGLTPNPRATLAKLVRRMYLDVIGLPPTPEQVDQFVNSRDPQAIENLVEELLDSPHFGEKWARHWMDVVRFAESHGFEQDYDRPHAYHYRDFLIRAMNQDLPYDQFVEWQLAGDELKPDEPLAQMATGFLGAGVFPTQLTEKEFEPARYDELDDMVATIGTAMLGITIGCARCHDHKFDPVPQRDYYRLVSTFATTIRSEVDLELEPGSHLEALAAWKEANRKLQNDLASYEQGELAKKFEVWLGAEPEFKPVKPGWIVLDFDKVTSLGGAVFVKQDDGSLLATGANVDFDQYELVARTGLRTVTAIRIEALADPSLVRNGPGRASNGNFALGNLSVSSRSPGEEVEKGVRLVRPRATFEQNGSNLSVASTIDDNPKTGWAVDPQFGRNHAALFDFEKPLQLEGETELTIRMKFDVNNRHSIGRLRISIATTVPVPGFEAESVQQEIVEILALRKTAAADLTARQRQLLFKWFARSDSTWQQLQSRITEHQKSEPRPVMTKVMISSEGLKPLSHHADGRNFPHFYPQTYFLRRGDTEQKQGVAEPGLLQVFARQKSFTDYHSMAIGPVKRLSYRRSALARWMTDPENGAGHQVARVIVNRIWQHYLGRGIVNTPNDFGFQGERPTHPELLDWLAQKLIDEDWSLKAIHRLILLSAVYQQSSDFDADDNREDNQNRWLWRYPPRRLDAELVRDGMLAVSGVLDRKMFGPGTLDENMTRRSVYFMIKRSRLVPMMQILDAPEPLVSVGSRPNTTIAPQALLFMNNANVRRYAGQFAERLLQDQAADVDKADVQRLVHLGFRLALARPATEAEVERNSRFIQRQRDSYRQDGHAEAHRMAVTDFCQVLFCLNEFIYVD